MSYSCILFCSWSTVTYIIIHLVLGRPTGLLPFALACKAYLRSLSLILKIGNTPYGRNFRFSTVNHTTIKFFLLFFTGYFIVKVSTSMHEKC